MAYAYGELRPNFERDARGIPASVLTKSEEYTIVDYTSFRLELSEVVNASYVGFMYKRNDDEPWFEIKLHDEVHWQDIRPALLTNGTTFMLVGYIAQNGFVRYAVNY